jgi:hypothetical protein
MRSEIPDVSDSVELFCNVLRHSIRAHHFVDLTREILRLCACLFAKNRLQTIAKVPLIRLVRKNHGATRPLEIPLRVSV